MAQFRSWAYLASPVVSVRVLRSRARSALLAPSLAVILPCCLAAQVVRGTVADEDGRPIPEAMIELVAPSSAAAFTISDDAGRFAFSGVEPPVVLLVSKIGFVGDSTTVATRPASLTLRRSPLQLDGIRAQGATGECREEPTLSPGEPWFDALEIDDRWDAWGGFLVELELGTDTILSPLGGTGQRVWLMGVRPDGERLAWSASDVGPATFPSLFTQEALGQASLRELDSGVLLCWNARSETLLVLLHLDGAQIVGADVIGRTGDAEGLEKQMALEFRSSRFPFPAAALVRWRGAAASAESVQRFRVREWIVGREAQVFRQLTR